jgi:hypothetical protein
MEVGHSGWLTVELTTDTTSRVKLEFPKQCIQSMPFQAAADYTAQVIANKYDNLHLGLSGGLDSEFVATVLLRNEIPFTPVMFDYGLNSAELWYAREFCRKNNLNPVITRMDLRDMLALYRKCANELNFVESFEINVVSVGLPLLYPDAHFITGYGGLDSSDTATMSGKSTLPRILEAMPHDWFLEKYSKQSHPGAFFSYTPEMMYSFIDSLNFTTDSQTAKSGMYGVANRPKIASSFWHHRYGDTQADVIYSRIVRTAHREEQPLILDYDDFKYKFVIDTQ